MPLPRLVRLVSSVALFAHMLGSAFAEQPSPPRDAQLDRIEQKLDDVGVSARSVTFCTVTGTNHEFSPLASLAIRSEPSGLVRARPFSRPTIIPSGLPSSNTVSGQIGDRPPNGRLPDNNTQRRFSPLTLPTRRENRRPFTIRPRSRTKSNRPCADLVNAAVDLPEH